MTIAPNAFQVPNIYVDRAMELLSDSEFRVLLFASRHIMGWQGNIDERQNRISLSVFELGFTTRNGYTCASCGLGRGSIIKALTKLVEFKFLEKVGKATDKGQQWKLMDNGIDWDALLARKDKNDASRKKQTAKATQAGIVKRTGTLDVLPTGTLDVTMQGIVERTTTGTLDVPIQSHGESHLENHEEKGESASAADVAEQYIDQHIKKIETGEMKAVELPKDETPKEVEYTEDQRIARLIESYLKASGTIKPTMYGNKIVRAEAKELDKQGIMPGHVHLFIKRLRQDEFWKGKEIKWTKVCGEIIAHFKARPVPYIVVPDVPVPPVEMGEPDPVQWTVEEFDKMLEDAAKAWIT